MMIINTNAWHYRLNEFIFDKLFKKDISDSLCIYFWQVVAALGLVSLVLFSVISTAFFWYVVGTDNYSIYSADGDGLLILKIMSLMGLIINMAGITFILLVVVVGVMTLIGTAYSFIRNTIKDRNQSIEPTFVTQYVRAKKEKICPMIQFEEKQK